MALLCILFGIIFERASDLLEKRRNFEWYDHYTRWLLKTLPGIESQNHSSILILLFPVLLFTGLFQSWIDGRMYGLLDLLFGLTLFLYCLGPKDLNRQIERYLQARETGDEAAAAQEAAAILMHEAPSDPDQQVVEVMRGVLYASNDRFFAVIFWFVILGPFGALFYRLSAHTMYHSNSATLAQAARQLQGILAWAPAHLTALGFALTGNYEGARREFTSKNPQSDLAESNYHSLITAGQGALKDCDPIDETACIRSARALVLRTLVVWLAFIGIFTLVGWMN